MRSCGRSHPFRSTAISFCHLILDLPTPATTLRETFRKALSVGYAPDNNEDEANRLTLQAISRYLRSQGASLSQFRLAEPAKVDREVGTELDTFLYRRDGLLQQSWESYEMMNLEQLSIYDRIFNSRRYSTVLNKAQSPQHRQHHHQHLFGRTLLRSLSVMEAR